MHKACAKIVQTVGKAWWNSVGEFPHSLWTTYSAYKNHADNPLFIPELSYFFTQRNPHAKSAFLYLLRPWLSTLSTQPITITTILKKKER